jgi:Ser/Thr protein kinase RdoA (MazF antagonist)
VNFAQLSSEQQIQSLLGPAESVVAKYGIDLSALESINHEYNSTFAVTAKDGSRYALRININSGRTEANIAAELFFVDALAQARTVKVATPIRNQDGNFVTKVRHDESDRELYCVLFSWLEGEDVGDEPGLDVVYQVGAAMAKMHDATKDLNLPQGADLPLLDDFMWHVEDLLLGPKSLLTAEEQSKIGGARTAIEAVVAELFTQASEQLIHADLHGWNLKFHNEELAVFDFDDSGFGLPIQDLATAIYYLDTPEQEAAMKAGYESVRPLPACSEHQMKALLLQRRIHLLNYIFETQNPEHRELLPEYQAETMRRVEAFLNA